MIIKGKVSPDRIVSLLVPVEPQSISLSWCEVGEMLGEQFTPEEVLLVIREAAEKFGEQDPDTGIYDFAKLLHDWSEMTINSWQVSEKLQEDQYPEDAEGKYV